MISTTTGTQYAAVAEPEDQPYHPLPPPPSELRRISLRPAALEAVVTSSLLVLMLLRIVSSFAESDLGLGVPTDENFGLPDSVVVVSPSSLGHAKARLSEALAANYGAPNCTGQFSSRRFAFLFLPGSYELDVDVGFYTSVAGLGRTPEEVSFTGGHGVRVRNCGPEPPGPPLERYPYADVGALDNFWRSAENLRVTGGPLMWAASQAAPLRSVVADSVAFHDGAGWGSGGYAANLRVAGGLDFGTQQQSFVRHSSLGGGVASYPSFSSVFVGCSPPSPRERCGGGGGAVASIDGAPVAEKPFLFAEGRRLWLGVPALRRGAARGPEARVELREQVMVGGEAAAGGGGVFVARAEAHGADEINAELARGRHVLLCPGMYALSAPLRLGWPGQVLLGLGFATLTPTGGTAAVVVAARGARLAGVLVQAGPERSRALVVVGDGTAGGHGTPDEPIVLSDVFVRVYAERSSGRQARATTMLWVRADHVLIDHAWLWRADHDSEGHFFGGENPVDHALEVDGRHVTAYGLFAEHTLADLTRWRGEDGTVYFYQSELPYDAPPPVWPHVGYNVSARRHTAVGVGVYSYFFGPVSVADAIVASNASGFVHPFTHLLSGGGAIGHVINGRGAAVSATGEGSYVCDAQQLGT